MSYKATRFSKVTTIRRCKQTNESIEETMDAIMKGACSLMKVNKSWNIPITSLLDHLNDKTRCMKKKYHMC